MEGSHSGLVRDPGKVVYPKGYREFESLTLRKRNPLERAAFPFAEGGCKAAGLSAKV